ncbi:NlpC/P60 family protein [Enterococcus viikkiensis]|uniref:NlpC/P60 family protein n=1 Tax=Enterococcus viikkiensis TaxID=930854 RepID=UPI0010F4B789|nr:NlpC/P60 family protein [Enterococcus viikkiensis]
MATKVLTRRELRQQKRQKSKNYHYLKKSSAVLGTALVTCSVVAPLLSPNEVEAKATNTSESTKSVDEKAFINKISKEIRPLAEKHDLYASVMIAQAIVESNWGQNGFAQAPYYNLFGLEGQYQGNSAILEKTDSTTGKAEKKELKKYASYKEAIEDYVEIMKTTSRDGNENYFSGSWRSKSDSYQAAAEALKGRFNDDDGYVQKLVSVIQDHDLASYDATKDVTPPVAQPAANTPTDAQEYTVQSGDSVYSITNQFGIGLEEFLSWNSIEGNTIYPGQKVVVSNGKVATKPVVKDQVVSQTETVATPVATTPTPEIPAPSNDLAGDQIATPEVIQPEVQSTTNQESIATPAPEQPAPTPEATPAPEQPAPTPEATPAPEQPAPTPEATPAPEQPAPTPEVTPAPEQPAPTPEATPAPEQPAPTPEATPAPEQSQQTSQGQQIVDEAEKYIGTQYVWGGKDPSGFDCSGLTQYVYKQVTGKDIGVWTVAQESSGQQISVSQAQQGDLLFWGQQGETTHVAISAGGDSYIHAPQPGESVKYGSTQYYAPDFGVRVY